MRQLTMRGMLVACAVVIACAPKKTAYQDIAAEANPYLETLRPTAASVLASGHKDRVAIVRACTGADEALWPLRKVRFDDARLGHQLDPDFNPSWAADQLLHDRCAYCGEYAQEPEKLSPRRLDRCVEFCIRDWRTLVESVERVRAEASEYGVEIVSLKPEAP